jgi:glucose-1-phosphate cytidylyltransferase
VIVAILCGGRGTRLQSHAAELPKPLVEIGGRPIVWHVIRIFAAQGIRDFRLLTGYRSEQVEAFVQSAEWPDGIDVRCIETGLDTPTGGRLWRVRGELARAPFLATYADGVADVDLGALRAFHAGHGGLATVTVVRPELPFGVALVGEDGRVTGFAEKPRAEHWLNGGFFAFEPRALDYLREDSVLEREPLERLAEGGELHAYRHEGFWACMDTYKDAVALNDLWAAGEAPWAPRAAVLGRAPGAPRHPE